MSGQGKVMCQDGVERPYTPIRAAGNTTKNSPPFLCANCGCKRYTDCGCKKAVDKQGSRAKKKDSLTSVMK